MANIVGVSFKNAGKLYYFSCGNSWPRAGEKVIAETEHGLMLGQVVGSIQNAAEDEEAPFHSIVRIATEEDLKRQEENEKKEEKAFGICKQLIEEHQLPMKLVKSQLSFDNSKYLFFFTANGRIDFRQLVKDLASVFHIRIELRQIGVRDEAKLLDSLGPCGRPICCSRFLGDFQTVGIRMAKVQNLSLNPAKISGVCGRLMCCLQFEEETYEEIHRKMPRIGKEVETAEGHGVVVATNIIREEVVVRIRKGDSFEQKSFPLEEVHFRMGSDPADIDELDDNDFGDSSPRELPPRQKAPRRESFRKAPAKAGERKENVPSEKPKPTSSPSGSEASPKPPKRNWIKAVEDALEVGEGKNA